MSMDFRQNLKEVLRFVEDDYDSVSAIAKFFNLVASASQKVAILVDDSNFLAWKQHVLLVLKTHRLQSYIDGSITIPPRMLTSDDCVSVENPAFIQYEQ
ncbi:hypothetical protein J1N35_038576 [Gossypium stocksii]|uniref:Retrotransposon Copia-like N-terminal domain-containing protein n=1 Tax=Gossypium stocksii TaxID=47602 RepID=A0A9D3ZMW3_9ROSI|nr:hypothetical protein J1N35_038576 [Gossypium stocksii]